MPYGDPLNEDDVMLFLAHQHTGDTVDEIAAVAASWSTAWHYALRRPGVALRLLVLRFSSFESLHTTAVEILYANSMARPCPVEIPPGPGLATCTLTRVGEQHLRSRRLLR